MARIVLKYFGAGTLSRIVKRKSRKMQLQISSGLAQVWRRAIASSALSDRAKRRYETAITPYRPPNAGAYISDKVSVLLELGWKRFDMKPGLISGKRYESVPIKKGTKLAIRKVSKSSPRGSWIHPGYRGAKVLSRVQRSIARIVKEAITNALTS